MPENILSILNTELANPDSSSTGITFNFRDEDYSADKAGFHPVEIRLSKHNNQWQFEYITDFSFQGFPYPELVKEIDICFHSKEMNTFELLSTKEFPLLFGHLSTYPLPHHQRK